ncbi:hypothetical protein GCM10027187_30550 [Streptosporangium sandarakinum]|uniref:Outer membrane protein assembly factor BamB n=1 Tax=Streptosporangium sandarakinum TaxID=1260955 RepID=A0A852UXQ6_9ACTN|nr:PQQ-binding-like beta-propeller repeat protein [Streptosporangium sandarakinum]NYF38385.1 outer membrane protein assembly factor BamB [Streptosporangium sandarakinum]
MTDQNNAPSQGEPYPRPHQGPPGQAHQVYPPQGGAHPQGAPYQPQGPSAPAYGQGAGAPAYGQQYQPQGAGGSPYGQGAGALPYGQQYQPQGPSAPAYGQGAGAPPYGQQYQPQGAGGSPYGQGAGALPYGQQYQPQGPSAQAYGQGAGAPPYGQQPPGQPYPPQAQPAPRPAGRRTGRTVLLVALGLVVLLGIGTGTAWFVSGGFGFGGSGDEMGAGEWQVPFTTAGTEVIGTDASIAFGAWVTDTAAVRAQKDGVLAYDLKTGKRVWGTPAPGEQLCGATAGIVGGKGALAYGTAKICDHVAGINVKTGKLLWNTKIPANASRAGEKSLHAPGLVLAGDLAVVRTAKQVSAYRLADGKKAWTSNASQTCETRDVAAAPKQVVVSLSCYGAAGDSVVVLDARTGALRGEHRIGEDDGGIPDHLLSADPVVAAWSGGESSAILVLDGSGKKLREFETGEKTDFLSLNNTIYINGGHEDIRAMVRGNTLYLATFPVNTKGGGISRDDVMAFDLGTGRKLWKSSGTGANLITFVDSGDAGAAGAAGGNGLLVIEEGGRNEPVPRLTRIDTVTGKAAPLADLPQKAGGESGKAHVHYRAGTLVIMPYQQIASRYAVTAVRADAG